MKRLIYMVGMGLMILPGCTTTRKNISQTTSHTDSVAILTSGSESHTLSDSIHFARALAYATASSINTYRIVTIDAGDTGDPSADYFTMRDSLVPELRGLKGRGARIRIESGTRSTTAASTSTRTDSSRVIQDHAEQLETRAETAVRSNSETRVKEVSRVGASAPIYVAIGLVLIAVGIVAYYYLRKRMLI